MSSSKDRTPREPWRTALREGDPARRAPNLDAQEIERMRRAVLAAAPEPRRRFVLTPVWGAALAAAALILAMGVGRPLWDRLRVDVVAEGPRAVSPVSPPASTPRVRPDRPIPPAPAVSPAPPAATPSARPVARPVPRPRTPEPETVPAQTVEPAPDFAPGPDLLEDPASGEALDSAALATETDDTAADLPRQVQFSTPGGTRIIWVLAAEDHPTAEAAPSRPEEKSE
jgi:hypothetical protein